MKISVSVQSILHNNKLQKNAGSLTTFSWRKVFSAPARMPGHHKRASSPQKRGGSALAGEGVCLLYFWLSDQELCSQIQMCDPNHHLSESFSTSSPRVCSSLTKQLNIYPRCRGKTNRFIFCLPNPCPKLWSLRCSRTTLANTFSAFIPVQHRYRYWKLPKFRTWEK